MDTQTGTGEPAGEGSPTGTAPAAAPAEPAPAEPAPAEPALPEQSVDDTDAGWGERSTGNDEWLLAERPPHWG